MEQPLLAFDLCQYQIAMAGHPRLIDNQHIAFHERAIHTGLFDELDKRIRDARTGLHAQKKSSLQPLKIIQGCLTDAGYQEAYRVD